MITALDRPCRTDPNAHLSRRQLLAGAGLLLAGCAADPAPVPSAPAEPRQVVGALGEVTIPAPPTRVVALGDFLDLDNLLSLGVLPVAYGYSNAWDKGSAPWQRTAGVPDLEQFDASGEVAVEAVVGQQPDLIVGMDWAITPVKDKLSAVSPVLALSESTPWRDTLTVLSRATWTDDRAREQIGATEQLLAKQAARLEPLGKKTIMIGSYYGTVVYVQGATSPFAFLADDLGLTFGPGGPEGLAELSLEKLDQLSAADVLLSFATDPAGTLKLQQNKLFQRLPAVRSGAYEALPTELTTAVGGSFSPVSAAWGLPQLADALLRCAAGEGRPLAG